LAALARETLNDQPDVEEMPGGIIVSQPPVPPEAITRKIRTFEEKEKDDNDRGAHEDRGEGNQRRLSIGGRARTGC
jgi:hypothetical protein